VALGDFSIVPPLVVALQSPLFGSAAPGALLPLHTHAGQARACWLAHYMFLSRGPVESKGQVAERSFDAF
jgi:hypothetical protein